MHRKARIKYGGLLAADERIRGLAADTDRFGAAKRGRRREGHISRTEVFVYVYSGNL